MDAPRCTLSHLQNFDHDLAPRAQGPVLHGVVEVPEDCLLAHGVVDRLGAHPGEVVHLERLAGVPQPPQQVAAVAVLKVAFIEPEKLKERLEIVA